VFPTLRRGATCDASSVEDSPVSRAVHGSQRGQVVRAAELPVQSVLPGGQVGGGDGGGVGGGGEELH